MFQVSNRFFLRRGLDRRRVRYCPRNHRYTTVLHTASFDACAKRAQQHTAVLARAALCSGLRRRAQSDRSRRGQQQQEECPVSFVIGSRSAAFRALHDYVPFGCTDAPVPYSASPLQDHIKDWKSIIKHCCRSWCQSLRNDFFVQPTSAVVAPPNLSVRKPTGNRPSRNDDRM
jgi:hypothetical protein